MIPGDLLSAFPHRQFHTIPGLLDSWDALPNSNPNACVSMQFVPFLWWSLVWPGREANSRPTVREADTLPTEPTRHGYFLKRALCFRPRVAKMFTQNLPAHDSKLLRKVTRVPLCSAKCSRGCTLQLVYNHDLRVLDLIYEK